MARARWVLFLIASAPAALQASICVEAAQAQDKCPNGVELQAVAAKRQEASSLLQSKQDLNVAKAAPTEQPVTEAVKFEEAPPRRKDGAAPSSAWSSLRGTARSTAAKLAQLPPGLLPVQGRGLLVALQAAATRLDVAADGTAQATQKGKSGSRLSKVRQFFFLSGVKAWQDPLGRAPHLGEGPGASDAAGAGPGASSKDPDVGVVVELASCLVYVVLVVSIAYIYVLFYRTEATERGNPLKPPGIDSQSTGSFHFGIWDCDGCCGRDVKICLCGWCCLGIRWADTLSQEKVRLGISFWSLLLLNAVSFGLDEVTRGLTTLAFLILAVYYRQRLRQAFKLENGTCGTIFKDCMIWCCCFPCAAIQEAREVEYVALPESS